MANKKEEKVVESTEEVKSEGGDMKVTAKAKKATKPKQLGKDTPDVAKVDLTKAKEEQPKDDVAKVDLSKTEVKEEPKEEV